MKKAIKVITLILIVGLMSAPAMAQLAGSGGGSGNGKGWDFFKTFFTGNSLNPNCTSINASPAQIMATKGNVNGMVITDKEGNQYTYTTNQ